MRLDHVSYVISHDQLADTIQRLGARLGSKFVDGDIHPRFGTRNFTLTVDRKVKIGPTAIPISGREQYSLAEGWSASDIGQAFKGFQSLIFGKSHDMKSILKTEWPNMRQAQLVKVSTELVPSANLVKK
jgi:hypothetical protein